jgi:hypothetical protein
MFFARQLSDLAEDDRRFWLSAVDIALLNPNTRTAPTFRWQRDAELAKRIHRHVAPTIGGSFVGTDCWLSHVHTRLFHMAEDSALFWSEPAPDRVPLYEGKMIHLFDHRFGTYLGQTPAQAAQGKLPELDDNQHDDPWQSVTPRYWLARLELDKKLGDEWRRSWLLGWRDITSSVSARTIVAAVIPRAAVAHTLILAFLKDPPRAFLFIANLSSFALDYSARQKVGGIHLNYHVFRQLPALPPETYDGAASWDPDSSISAWIAPRVCELTYTAWDMEPFARDLGYHGAPFHWDAQRRFLLRCELDAAFFHLYGLSRGDVDYVMDTFPIVRERDVKAHGEYRTKRVILAIYDDMAQSIETTQPYQTRLDPAPADPRVAHLPRAEDIATAVRS